MTKTILSLCLAAAGFVGLTPAPVSAHEASASVTTTRTAVASLPATVRINQSVVIETNRRGPRYNRSHRRGYHRSYRHPVRRHAYYRHGRRYYR